MYQGKLSLRLVLLIYVLNVWRGINHGVKGVSMLACLGHLIPCKCVARNLKNYRPIQVFGNDEWIQWISRKSDGSTWDFTIFFSYKSTTYLPIGRTILKSISEEREIGKVSLSSMKLGIIDDVFFHPQLGLQSWGASFLICQAFHLSWKRQKKFNGRKKVASST